MSSVRGVREVPGTARPEAPATDRDHVAPRSRSGARRAGSRVLVYGLVLVVAAWLVAPFAWLFVTSISYQKHLLARPLSFIPPEVTLDNYRMILGLVRFHAEGQAAKILPSMLNTLIVSLVVTVLNLVVGTTAGYAYARFRFPLKHVSLYALLFTRMLPTVVLVPAFFLLFRTLGLQNTLTGLVVAYCSFTLPSVVRRDLDLFGPVNGRAVYGRKPVGLYLQQEWMRMQGPRLEGLPTWLAERSSGPR